MDIETQVDIKAMPDEIMHYIMDMLRCTDLDRLQVVSKTCLGSVEMYKMSSVRHGLVVDLFNRLHTRQCKVRESSMLGPCLCFSLRDLPQQILRSHKRPGILLGINNISLDDVGWNKMCLEDLRDYQACCNIYELGDFDHNNTYADYEDFYAGHYSLECISYLKYVNTMPIEHLGLVKILSDDEARGNLIIAEIPYLIAFRDDVMLMLDFLSNSGEIITYLDMFGITLIGLLVSFSALRCLDALCIIHGKECIMSYQSEGELFNKWKHRNSNRLDLRDIIRLLKVVS